MTDPPIDDTTAAALPAGDVEPDPELVARPRPPMFKDPLFYAGVGIFAGAIVLAIGWASRGGKCADCERRRAALAAVDRHVTEHPAHPDPEPQPAAPAAAAAEPPTPVEPTPTPPAAPAPVGPPAGAPTAAAPEPPSTMPAGNGSGQIDVAAIAQLPAHRAGLTAVPGS